MPIFDQGYQHWRGPLAGHFWRWLAITRQGVRVQLKNRLLRFFMIVAWLPCVALVLVMVLWGLVEQKSEVVLRILSFLPKDLIADPRSYRVVVWTLSYSFFFKVQLSWIMFLVIFAGPGLISQDLRFNALPLYFARPLTRMDYFLGKLGVIGTLVAAVAIGPAIFAYILGVCFSLDLSVVRDTYKVFFASVAYGLVITLSVGTFILALSSLSKRSLYIAITWAGLWFISSTTTTVLIALNAESERRAAHEAVLQHWIAENPPPPGTKLLGNHPQMRLDAKTGRYTLAGVEPGHEREAERWCEAWMEESQAAFTQAEQEQGARTRRDWRPLVSYGRNLERIADQLLDTDGAWVTLGRAEERARAAAPRVIFGPGGRPKQKSRPEPIYERRLADLMVPQYPWVWSAGVLAALLGLSVWILTRRVKSLDRLR